MSGQLYNLIMASMPGFYPDDEGEFTIPKDRFLQYTEDTIKEQFQSLDQDVINKLKSLPTIFAVEDEVVDARIGKITVIKVDSNNLRAKYRFDKNHYPLTRGVLKEYQQKLGIDDFEFHRGHWAVKECDISDFYEGYLKSLTGIAHKLKNADKKVQLIYAFNGTGKTRLSRALKNVVVSKSGDGEEESSRNKFLYYNAFTEDLFYWDNDLANDLEPKLKIHPNSFTDWILREIKDEGLEAEIAKNFHRYNDEKLTPKFNPEYKIKGEDGKEIVVPAFSEIEFTYERGDDSDSGKIKISKGEESSFIWAIFYTLLDLVITTRNVSEEDERDEQFDELEYVFIDDPVTSLDENHLIALAVNIGGLLKKSDFTGGKGLRFVITTHNPLFYNVLHNELGLNAKGKREGCYLLEKLEDGTYHLNTKYGDSNKSFSYHLHIKKIIEKAILDKQVEKYHFMLLRNLYEKTASFLGYKEWADILPDDKKVYASRVMNFYPHNTLSNAELPDPTEQEKATLDLLLKNLNKYGYWQEEVDSNAATN